VPFAELLRSFFVSLVAWFLLKSDKFSPYCFGRFANESRPVHRFFIVLISSILLPLQLRPIQPTDEVLLHRSVVCRQALVLTQQSRGRRKPSCCVWNGNWRNGHKVALMPRRCRWVLLSLWLLSSSLYTLLLFLFLLLSSLPLYITLHSTHCTQSLTRIWNYINHKSFTC